MFRSRVIKRLGAVRPVDDRAAGPRADPVVLPLRNGGSTTNCLLAHASVLTNCLLAHASVLPANSSTSLVAFAMMKTQRQPRPSAHSRIIDCEREIFIFR